MTKRILIARLRKISGKPSFYSECQAAESLSTDKSGAAGDNAEPNTRKDALQAQVPWPVYQKKSINPFFDTLSTAGSPENDLLVYTTKTNQSTRS
jgi:hypothetical protein